MTKSRKFIKYWLPAVVWASLIFLVSSFPTGVALEIDWQDFIIKKSAHAFEYGVLTTLVYRAFRNSGVETKKAGIYAIMFAIFYGATDEFHQMFVPGREPRMRDIVFDTIGSVISIFVIWRLLPGAPKRLKDLAKSLQIL